jgi:2-polyprenyl-6-methoxyphenol hydroxylase-like FAD-dependent oxidoreductase
MSMTDHNNIIHDVVIAGGGPVGLFLACELRLAGLSVLVLEQAPDAKSPLKQLPLGMRGLSAASLEALDRRGLLDDLREAQRASEGDKGAAAHAHWLQQPRRPAGHFAGLQFHEEDIDSAAWPYRLPGPAGTSMMVTLDVLETVLAARARAMGVEIRYGAGVEGFEQSEEAVTVRAGGAVFRGRWLVGCDGARSVVRKAGGFGFMGTEPEFTGYSAMVELADPDALRPGRHQTPAGMYSYARPGTLALAEFDGGSSHRAGPITRDQIEAVLRRVSGTDVRLTALRIATSWTDRAFQATRYRDGRVLIAGDAAHIHSPLGGQGLNLGLGDAMNLGWKLAATVQGWAPAGLLDTYQQERHPIGAQVLDWSRAQVALMRPSPAERALRAIIGDLIETKDGATYFAGRVWGVGMRYDLGGDHPIVGRSVPDFEMADGRRVGALLREGRGLLLDFRGRGALRKVAERWGGRIGYVAGRGKDELGLSALLVRPDGFVAWCDDERANREGAAAREAAQWFGRLCTPQMPCPKIPRW